MTFRVTHRWGQMERNPTVERLKEVMAQLDVVDDEHVSVALTHESVTGAFGSSGVHVLPFA
jgi:hypothetical protein